VRIVRLGRPRIRGEGVRIGTVRHPPRGVPKREHAAQDWYDVWLPELAPSARLVARALAAETEREWAAFAKAYRREMGAPQRRRMLDLLAALSHAANFSVGCYCAEESRCHRSVLRALLEERGARVAWRVRARSRPRQGHAPRLNEGTHQGGPPRHARSRASSASAPSAAV